MAIAYDGEIYEDQAALEAVTNPNVPESLKKLYHTPSTTPPQAPTEPTGALESSGSTEVPAEVLKPKLAMNLKTASPFVTITDEDIDKGMGLGMAFSGGGLSTTGGGKVLQMRKKAANDNVPDLVNPNMSPVEQLARKLAEIENGKGSWDRIGGGGQEHYWRDAEKALKQRRPSDYDGIQRYNLNEPNMIGSEAMDAHVDKTWKAFGDSNKKSLEAESLMRKENLSEIDAARVRKLQKEAADLMKRATELLNE